MCTHKESVPSERSNRDKSFETCFIFAPRVFLLKQLFPSSGIVEKKHQGNLGSSGQLQTL